VECIRASLTHTGLSIGRSARSGFGTAGTVGAPWYLAAGAVSCRLAAAQGHARGGGYNRRMPPRKPRRTTSRRRPRRRGSPAAWLAEAEALFRDFARLTPYPYVPFVRSFDSFEEYERWRRAQTNPWYR